MWADYLLYDHFKKKFVNEKEAYGLHQLNHEKEILKRATDHIKERCIEAQVDNNLLSKKEREFMRKTELLTQNRVLTLQINNDFELPY